MTVITLPAAMTRPAGASVIRVERRQDGLRIAADDAIAEEVPVAQYLALAQQLSR